MYDVTHLLIRIELVQISNLVFCDTFIMSLKYANKITPNPYRDLPYLIIKNFLTPELLLPMVKEINRSQDAEAAAIKKTKKRSVVDPQVDHSIRKTLIYRLNEIDDALYLKAFIHHQQIIEDFFSLAVTTSTKVQVLRYKKDYFYKKHADDSSEIINKNKETIGFKVVAPNRKLTTILFGTSGDSENGDEMHFTGGELKFNYLFDARGESITIKACAGDMIIFPSNPIYSHEVMPVKSGNRITLVQWHNAIVT